MNAKVPANTVAELVDYAKKNPGKVSYASQGNGSSGHMMGEQFKLVTGTDIVHVPYRGAAPAVQDLVAGQVQMMFDTVTLQAPQLEAGNTRALAITANQRLTALPNVPTDDGSRASRMCRAVRGSACSRRPARRRPRSTGSTPR